MDRPRAAFSTLVSFQAGAAPLHDQAEEDPQVLQNSISASEVSWKVIYHIRWVVDITETGFHAPVEASWLLLPLKKQSG